MKFIYGMPPEVTPVLRDPQPQNVDYKKLIHRSLWISHLLALPLLLLPWLAVVRWVDLLHVFNVNVFALLGVIAAIMVVHELVHMLAHPRAGFSSSTWLGVAPRVGAAYAYYAGVITRQRMLVCLWAPFVVLTVGPFLLSLVAPAAWRPWMAWCSIFNGCSAVGDLMQIAIIHQRIPKNALLHGEFYGYAAE